MLSNLLFVSYLGQTRSDSFCVAAHNGPAFTPFGRNFALYLGLSLLNMLSYNTWLFREVHFPTVLSTIHIVET